MCDNLLKSGLGEVTGDVFVDKNLQTHLFMQFSGVYIKAHISLSDVCFTVTIKPFFKGTTEKLLCWLSIKFVLSSLNVQ